MLRAATTLVPNSAGIPHMPVLTRNGEIRHVASGERFPRDDASPDMEVVVPGKNDRLRTFAHRKAIGLAR
jgi:hypothetical protein